MFATMKTIFGLFMALFLMATAMQASTTAKPSAGMPPQAVEMAKAVTKITGVAISPLLGTSAVGAWDWVQAKTPEQKAKLQWYAHPAVWLPAMLLVGAVALKDAGGVVVPPGRKKPLDVAETIENKVSGLVAAGAFVPLAASIFSFSSGSSSAMADAHVHLAMLGGFNPAGLLDIVTVPFAMVAFGAVWLVAHTINVLILLSPWGVVDAGLKSFRTALLGLVTVTHFVNPWAGFILSLIIILLAWLVAGWSFRLLIFGSVYVWDFVTGRKHRFTPAVNGNWVFTSRKIEKTPSRTYGQLMRSDDGKLTMEYRKWLWFGMKKSVALPAGKYVVGRGLFYSEVLLVDGEKEKMFLLLPPRYRTHEEEMAKVYGFVEVRATGLRRTWQWLKSLLGFGAKTVPATA
jgi:hypothetical protein